MEIRKVLGLSTAHIRETTANLLERESDENNLGLTVYPFAYGYWVFVNNSITEKDNEDYDSNIPKDLMECMQLAHQNDCQWIQFDCDGPEETTLPLYQ